MSTMSPSILNHFKQIIDELPEADHAATSLVCRLAAANALHDSKSGVYMQ